jgi:hypothetical protein
MNDQHLLSRIRSEFLEMPGLHLTLPQARKLWHLDEPACRAALAELVRSHFLVERANGGFTRASDGPRQTAAKRMAKVLLTNSDDRVQHRAR